MHCAHLKKLKTGACTVAVPCYMNPAAMSKPSAVSACALHGYCLPNFRPNSNQQHAWEKRHLSRMFKLCYQCNDQKVMI